MTATAEMVATGSELLSGRTLNRHCQTMGRALGSLGIRLMRETSIPDDVETIRTTVAAALERSDIVFVSGGLGPTGDDVTRTAIAGLLERNLVRDADALENIRRLCLERGRELTEFRARQADIIAGAIPLPNRLGAAPGEMIELDNSKLIFVLPGPPTEFGAIMEDHILPQLAKKVPVDPNYLEATYLICGLPEADALQIFQDHAFPPTGIEAAFCASPGALEIRLATSTGDRKLLASADKQLRHLVGEKLFADWRTTMEEVVGALLAGQGRTVAVAESCTGGLLGSRLTSVSGSSRYFLGGVIAYSNAVKTRELGVEAALIEEEGAVSAVVAEQLATGARNQFAADYGIGITGIAGPSGGTDSKPLGLVYIGLADAGEVQTARYQFGRGRNRVRFAATQMALDMLRLKLQENA